jgi:hypothetical protein
MGVGATIFPKRGAFSGKMARHSPSATLIAIDYFAIRERTFNFAA